MGSDTNPATCENCGRPMNTRACAADEHRQARGEPTRADELPPGKRRCPRCGDVKATAKFFERGPDTQNGLPRRTGTIHKTCNHCRARRRAGRNTSRRGANLATRRETDTFWERQAATH